MPKKFVRKVDPHTLRDLINGSNGKALTSQRCTATSKRTGERCRAWALRGAKTCRVHGSATRASKVAAAKRVAEASGFAADMLAEFMADPNVDLKTRTQIAQDLLNRAGVNGKQELEVTVGMVPGWEAGIQDLFVQYPDSDLGVIEAVVVSEDQENEQGDEVAERARVKRRRAGYSGDPVTPPPTKRAANRVKPVNPYGPGPV